VALLKNQSKLIKLFSPEHGISVKRSWWSKTIQQNRYTYRFTCYQFIW